MTELNSMEFIELKKPDGPCLTLYSRSPIDALAAAPSPFSERLTGAGFGGACVALCERGRARALGLDVVRQFNTGGRASRLLVPPASKADQARQKQ